MQIIEIDESETMFSTPNINEQTESNLVLWTGIDSWMGDTIDLSDLFLDEVLQ